MRAAGKESAYHIGEDEPLYKMILEKGCTKSENFIIAQPTSLLLIS